MHRVGNGFHVPLEQAASVRIGDHYPRHVRPEPCLQRLQIHAAILIRRNIFGLVAGKGGSRRISAMCAFGHQHHLAGIATSLQRGANRQHPAQFPVRPRLGAHRYAVHPGELDEPESEFVNHFQRAANRVDGLQRMDIGKARHPRNLLVEARVVFHRAGAEGKQAQIDGVVLPGKARIVPHCLGFGKAGKANGIGAFHAPQTVVRSRCRSIRLIRASKVENPRKAEIDTRRLYAADLEDQRLFQHQGAVAGDCRRPVMRPFVRDGTGGFPARLVGRVHAPAPSRAEASVSMSSSLAVSVTAITRPSASSVWSG